MRQGRTWRASTRIRSRVPTSRDLGLPSHPLYGVDAGYAGQRSTIMTESNLRTGKEQTRMEGVGRVAGVSVPGVQLRCWIVCRFVSSLPFRHLPLPIGFLHPFILLPLRPNVSRKGMRRAGTEGSRHGRCDHPQPSGIAVHAHSDRESDMAQLPIQTISQHVWTD